MVNAIVKLWHRGHKKRETFIWVGDGISTATPELIGLPYVGKDGRTGVVVSTNQLTITVEYDVLQGV